MRLSVAARFLNFWLFIISHSFFFSHHFTSQSIILGLQVSHICESSVISLMQLFDHPNHFQKFMLELSENQVRVGAVLEEGARLLSEQRLSRDEAAEVRLQMRLLRERWEGLRLRAMDHQSQVHAALIKGQQDQIDKFRYSFYIKQLLN